MIGGLQAPKAEIESTINPSPAVAAPATVTALNIDGCAVDCASALLPQQEEHLPPPKVWP